jgi:hypothetical protein
MSTPDSKESPPVPTSTPAGGQINCDWEDLDPAIDGLICFLSKIRPCDAHVVFRCGTVARIDDDADEFKGYSRSSYAFPEYDKSFDKTVGLIMADNCRVWEGQKTLGSANAGRAIRQGYASLIRQGYPYPGPDAVRWGQKTDALAPNGSPLLLVHWPALDTRGRVFNLALGKNVELIVNAAGDARRSDFMFPEVAAVIIPVEGKLEVWRYSGGQFGVRAH